MGGAGTETVSPVSSTTSPLAESTSCPASGAQYLIVGSQASSPNLAAGGSTDRAVAPVDRDAPLGERGPSPLDPQPRIARVANKTPVRTRTHHTTCGSLRPRVEGRARSGLLRMSTFCPPEQIGKPLTCVRKSASHLEYQTKNARFVATAVVCLGFLVATERVTIDFATSRSESSPAKTSDLALEHRSKCGLLTGRHQARKSALSRLTNVK